MDKKTSKFYLFAIFVVLGLIALQIPLTKILGADTRLTVFDSFAPLAGGILSAPFAIIALLGIQGSLLFTAGISAAVLIKLLTPLAGSFYFGKKNIAQLIIPIVSILAFVIHPVGREVWYYSLFWTIPVICYFIKDHSVMAKSLGAVFSAHAVGGALWIYFVGLPKAVWIALIPTVAIERLTLAIGTAVFFLAFKKILEGLYEAKAKQAELKHAESVE